MEQQKSLYNNFIDVVLEFHFCKIIRQLFCFFKKGQMKLLYINAMSSTEGWLSILDVITMQCNVTPRFCSAQECVMFTILLDNSSLNKMSKRRSAAVVRQNSADGISQIFELTNTPVHQKSYEKHEINWDKCFTYQRDSTEKLQNSLEVQLTDPVKACEELGHCILKFESLNALPVPIELIN